MSNSTRTRIAKCGHKYTQVGNLTGRPRNKCFECLPMKPSSKVWGSCQLCGMDMSGMPLPARGPRPKYCGDRCRNRASVDNQRADGRYQAKLAQRRESWQPALKSDRECVICGSTYLTSRVNSETCSPACTNSKRESFPIRLCSVEGCSRAYRAKDLCAMHWRSKAREDGREKPPLWTEARRATYHKRRAQKFKTQVQNIIPVDVYIRDGWNCGICYGSVDPTSTFPDPMSPSLDHILPLSKGGTHTLDNVQLAHLRCNCSKGNRIAEIQGV